MEDPLKDPRYPDRPQHPDFWKLSDSINYLDGTVTEGGVPVEDVLAQHVDVESIVYMADQRIMRAFSMGVDQGRATNEILIALYLDAFTLGCRYTNERRPT